MEPGADANRAYVGKIAADLVAGDDDLLLQKMWWFPLGKRACMGLRVALGVQTGLTTQQPGPNDAPLGPLGDALARELESRVRAGFFGPWPQSADSRVRQVVILKSDSLPGLFASARYQGVDLVFLLGAENQASGDLRSATSAKVSLVDVAEQCALVSWPAPGGAGGTGDDPALAAEIVKYLDSNGALVAIPEFIVQDVKRCITTLARMTQGLRNLAPMLAEVRLYQVKQLLTPNDAAVLYEAVLGQGRGSLVADGDAAKRREVLDAWLRDR